MAWDLESALDEYEEAAASYRTIKAIEREKGLAAWESPERQRASAWRSKAFKECVRRVLGMEVTWD